MTTDNKTLAVDVLAVMDREAKLARHYRIENGAVKVAEEASADACAAREAVAELIAAGDSLTAAFRALGLDSSLINRSRLARDCEEAMVEFDAALARVKGESA